MLFRAIKRMKKKFALLLFSAIVAANTGSVLMTPKPANAAALMENMFNNFLNNGDINDSVKGGIKMFAAFMYALPIIVPVAGVVGIGMASRGSGNEDLVKGIGTGVIGIMVLIGVAWLYDANMVQKIALTPSYQWRLADLPRPLQIAALEVAKELG